MASLSYLESIADQYWAKVDRRTDDECWPWLGASRNGRGPTTLSLGVLEPPQYAYRLAFQYEYGSLEDGTAVRRRCGNVLCVNPCHLYIHNKHAWSPEEAREAHRNFMRAYMNDPDHPERKEKKRELDRRYGSEHRQEINDRAKAHYQEHKEARQTYIQEYQMKNKIRAVNYLGGACACGQDHPSALQFHHRDPSTKSFNVTSKELSSPKKYPWDTAIVPELDKCDLLCSNCHFIQHARLSVDDIERLCTEIKREQ